MSFAHMQKKWKSESFKPGDNSKEKEENITKKVFIDNTYIRFGDHELHIHMKLKR